MDERHKDMLRNADRLKEIQAELDVLMDEVAKLRLTIATESTRRTFPFSFERTSANAAEPRRRRERNGKHRGSPFTRDNA
jgi:hypothetical protein